MYGIFLYGFSSVWLRAADRDNANGGAEMRGLLYLAITGGGRGTGFLGQHRRWHLVVLVVMIAAVPSWCAAGAGAVGLSRAWLAHSPFRAFSTRAESQASAGIASRSLQGVGPRTSLLGRIAARRSVVGRGDAHAAVVGGGSISGKVTASATDAAIAGIEVCAYENEEPFAETCGTTNAAGEYTLAGLEPGEYIVVFFAPFESQLNYLTQFYDGKSSESEAESVPVTAGEAVSGIDASLHAGARITGLVVNGSDKAVAGIDVCALEDVFGFAESCATTNASGEYAVVGLATGEYDVEFSSPSNSGLNYITQFYDEEPTFFEAEAVTATAGATTPEIDAKLRVGGQIKGRVTSAATKAAVGEIVVCAYEEELEYARCATTNSLGEYTILGLATGSYEVEFSESPELDRNYATQYYDDKESPTEADLVAVTAGAITSGIDAALTPGGQITGKVTALSSHAPLDGIEVCAFPLETFSFRCATTNASGEYEIGALSTGEYIVGFHSDTGEYATQFYKDASSFASAEEIFVEAGQTKSGIDAALTLEPPRDITLPVISGSAVEGQVLKVVHGSWSDSPTSFVDEWGRCDAAGDLETCKTIGVGEELTLSAADVGHAIRLREAASNEGGKGPFAYSAPTAAVAALPPTSGGSGSSGGSASTSSTSTGGGGGSTGVLGVTTVRASAAQLKTLLAGLLVPQGRNAKIEALLEHGGYVASFNALSGGQIAISWYLVPKGGHLATAKPTLVARGSVSFTAAGAEKLAIKLTADGSKLLKHAKELKLTAQGTITQSGEGAIGATESFVVRR